MTFLWWAAFRLQHVFASCCSYAHELGSSASCSTQVGYMLTRRAVTLCLMACSNCMITGGAWPAQPVLPDLFRCRRYLKPSATRLLSTHITDASPCAGASTQSCGLIEVLAAEGQHHHITPCQSLHREKHGNDNTACKANAHGAMANILSVTS